MKAAAEPLDRWVGLYGPQPLYGYEVTTVFCTLFTPAIVVLLYFRNHPRYNIAGLLVASEPGGHTPLVRNHAHVREDTRPSSALLSQGVEEGYDPYDPRMTRQPEHRPRGARPRRARYDESEESSDSEYDQGVRYQTKMHDRNADEWLHRNERRRGEDYEHSHDYERKKAGNFFKDGEARRESQRFGHSSRDYDDEERFLTGGKSTTRGLQSDYDAEESFLRQGGKSTVRGVRSDYDAEESFLREGDQRTYKATQETSFGDQKKFLASGTSGRGRR